MQSRKPNSNLGLGTKGKYGNGVKAMGKTRTDFINNNKKALNPAAQSTPFNKSPLSSNAEHIKFSSKQRDFTPIRGGKVTQSWNDGEPVSLSLSASRIDGYSEMQYDPDDLDPELNIQEVAVRGNDQQLLASIIGQSLKQGNELGIKKEKRIEHSQIGYSNNFGGQPTRPPHLK